MARSSQYFHVTEKRREQAIRVVKKLIEHNRIKWLNQLLMRIHPSDMAALWLLFSDHEQNFILNQLTDENSALFLAELDSQVRSSILKSKNPQWVARRLKELEPDDSVDILKDISSVKADKIIRKFNDKYSKKIKELLKYPEGTAGALMTSDFFAVMSEANIETIIKQFRKKSRKEQMANLHFIYVVDSQNHLLGYIPIRKLILENPRKKASEIMNPPPIRINPQMDQEEVANIFQNYDLISLPIVDEENVILGRITIDDIVDVMEEEASEDVYHMFGVHKEEKLTNGIFLSLKNRFPWMFINVLTTSLSALVIGFYKGLIEQYVVLAMFLPMVAALGGAIGNQTVVVIVRGIASGKLYWSTIKWVFFRDISAVTLGALLIGFMVGGVSYLIFHNYLMGIVVAMALLLNMIFGTIMGVGIPIVLKLLKLDPAYGSSILLSASTDIMGFFIFLWLASETFL